MIYLLAFLLLIFLTEWLFKNFLFSGPFFPMNFFFLFTDLYEFFGTSQLAQWYKTHLQFRRCKFVPSGRFPVMEMAAHSRILAWEIPWTEEPGGLNSLWGLSRARHDRMTKQWQRALCTWSHRKNAVPSLSGLFVNLNCAHIFWYRIWYRALRVYLYFINSLVCGFLYISIFA